MKRIILLALICIGATVSSRAEVDIEITSTKVSKDRRPVMHFINFMGKADGIVYALYSNKLGKKQNDIKNLFVYLHDADDMEVIKKIPLYNTNKKDKNIKKMEYYDHLLTDKGIIFYFTQEGKGKSFDVLLAAYDFNLKMQGKPKKVATIEGREEVFFGMFNPKFDNMVIVTISKVKKNEEPEMEYQIYDSNFEFVKRDKVEMPLEVSGLGRKAISNNMTLTDDGYLITTVAISEKNDKKVEKGGIKSKRNKNENIGKKQYRTFFFLNTEDNAFTHLRLSDKKMRYELGEYEWIVSKGEINICGFYSESKKDGKKKKRNIDLNGVFYMRVDIEKQEIIEEKFTSFSEDFIQAVNSQNTMISRRKRKKESAEESISELFSINTFILGADKSLTVYCEPRYNSSHQNCSGTGANQHCYTVYTSARGSLFYFKVNSEGEMVMYNSIRKYIYFSSTSSDVWSKKSMRLFRKNSNTDIVLYQSSRAYNPKDKKDMSGTKIKYKHVNQAFSIAEIDLTSGSFEETHPIRDKKKYRKMVPADLANAVKYGDKLYFTSQVAKVKLELYIPSFVVFPLYYYFILNPNALIYTKTQHHVATFDNRVEN
jgi:hypothetical protein